MQYLQHLEAEKKKELVALGLTDEDMVNLLEKPYFRDEPISLLEWEIVAPISYEEFKNLATLKTLDVLL